MIRFSDIAENGTNTEILDKHTDIKPSDRMTDQEADAFWKAEFQKAHDEVSLDEYDILLSEVFNRSEDELDIDFDIDDRFMAILERFDTETCENLNESDKTDAISDFVNALGEGLGLEDIPATIVFDDSNDLPANERKELDRNGK